MGETRCLVTLWVMRLVNRLKGTVFRLFPLWRWMETALLLVLCRLSISTQGMWLRWVPWTPVFTPLGALLIAMCMFSVVKVA